MRWPREGDCSVEMGIRTFRVHSLSVGTPSLSPPSASSPTLAIIIIPPHIFNIYRKSSQQNSKQFSELFKTFKKLFNNNLHPLSQQEKCHFSELSQLASVRPPSEDSARRSPKNQTPSCRWSKALLWQVQSWVLSALLEDTRTKTCSSTIPRTCQGR